MAGGVAALAGRWPAAAQAPATSARFAVEEYIRSVLAVAPDVLQAREAYRSSQLQWLSTLSAAVLPTVSFSETAYPYGYNPANGYKFNTWRLNASDLSRSTTLNWTVFNSFKDAQGVRSAAWARNSSEYSLLAAEQSRALQAIQAYFDFGLKTQLLSVNQQNLEAEREQYRVSADLYQHGLKSLADLLKSETDLHSAELRVADAEADLKTSLLNFNILLDRSPEAPAALTTDLELGATDLPRLSEDVGLALERRPEMLRTRADFKRSEVALEQSVQTNILPSVTFNAVWNRQDVASFGLPPSAFGIPNPNYYAGLSFSLPFNFNIASQVANVASAAADRRRAADGLKAEERQIRQDVHSAYIQLERAYKDYRIAALKEDIAKRSLDLVNEQYQQGTADAIRLAQAQLDYLDARVSRSQALHDAFFNRAQYHLAVGEPLWK